MSITMIAAIDKEGGFGLDGKLPWHYPEDFKHFKEKTTGKVCVMGRVTYEDMLLMALSTNRPINDGILPKRECYVISSNPKYNPIGAKRVGSIEEVQQIHKNEEIMVLGGSKLFSQCIDVAEHIWLTVIDKTFDCDRFFPTDKLDRFIIKEGNQLVSASGDTLYFVLYTTNKE